MDTCFVQPSLRKASTTFKVINLPDIISKYYGECNFCDIISHSCYQATVVNCYLVPISGHAMHEFPVYVTAPAKAGHVGTNYALSHNRFKY